MKEKIVPPHVVDFTPERRVMPNACARKIEMEYVAKE